MQMKAYGSLLSPVWSCHKVCDALTFLLDNTFIQFGTMLYRHVVWIPMGTNSAPIVADLFLFCYGGGGLYGVSFW